MLLRIGRATFSGFMTTPAEERFLTNTTLGATPFLLPTPLRTTGAHSTPSATADITSILKPGFTIFFQGIMTPPSAGLSMQTAMFQQAQAY